VSVKQSFHRLANPIHVTGFEVEDEDLGAGSVPACDGHLARTDLECFRHCPDDCLICCPIDGWGIHGHDQFVLAVASCHLGSRCPGLDADGEAELGHAPILSWGTRRGPNVLTMGMSATVTACPACGAKNRVPAVASGRPRCASCKKDLPWIAEATDSSFAGAIETSSLVLVDLWAPWCGPCRMVAPVLEKLAARYAGRLKVVKVNVDENPTIARTYDASSIPTLVMLRDGQVVGRVVGAQPEPALAQQIEPLLPAAP